MLEAPGKLISVLLVDDDPEDIELTLEVMKMTKMKLDVDIAGDGIQAFQYLEKCTEEKKALPDLILLDLNMPRMNGLEFLDKIKKDERYH